MSNLVQRILTGIVFLVVLIGAILFSPYTFGGLFLFITVVSIHEFYELIKETDFKPQRVVGLISGVLIFATTFAYSQELVPASFLAIGMVVPFVAFFVEMYRNKANPIGNIASTLFPLIYVAIPYAFVAVIYAFANVEVGGWFLLGIFILLWTSDIMAYVCGTLFGKHKLFERLSPKKSWEGTIGGAIFTALVAYFGVSEIGVVSQVDWAVIAIIIVVAGGMGDLIESMFKRSVNVKDSGNILPGHGGFLDRFDGILMASPFIYLYLTLVY